jgi:hypothetical protein
MTEDEMRAEWREAGGGIHGPNIETVVMSESQYFAFRRRLAQAPLCEECGIQLGERIGALVVKS